MGQRLNIELSMGDDVQVYVNCYYHWSAYTISALYTLNTVIANYHKIKDQYTDPFLLATKCMEIPDIATRRNENGEYEKYTCYAGLCDESKKLMKFLYPDEEFHDATNRNVGLISVHPEDVDNTRTWEEGRINVNLTNETFTFDVYWMLYEDELKEWYPELRRDQIAAIPNLIELGIDIINDEIPFCKIPKLMELFETYNMLKAVDFDGKDVFICQFS